MSLDGDYANDNVFARILRGDMPKVMVAEDADTLAIMDVFPQSPGHVLVLPKAASRHLLDSAPETLAPLFIQVRRVAAAARAALKPDGVLITQLNGAAAGQTVFHLHVHVIPVWTGRPLGRHAEGMADLEDLRTVAAAIAAELR